MHAGALCSRESYKPEPMFTKNARYLYGMFYDAVTDLVQFPKFAMPLGRRGSQPTDVAADVELAMRSASVPICNTPTSCHAAFAADQPLVAMYGDALVSSIPPF